jgi:hypothetical protein
VDYGRGHGFGGVGLDDMGVMGNHNELTVICHF